MYGMPDLFDPMDIEQINTGIKSSVKWLFVGMFIGSFVNIAGGKLLYIFVNSRSIYFS